MGYLFFAFLVASVLSKLTMRINKQFSLTEVLAEEIYTVSATNEYDFNIKRLSFSFREPFFSALKNVKLYEGTTVLAIDSTLTDNRFHLNFTNPKRPGESFGFKIIAYYLKPFQFVPYKLKVAEDQKIEFADHIMNVVFEDTVDIEKVYGKYILPSQIHSYSREFIYTENKNSFGHKELILNDILPPFTDKLFRCHYTYERPYETLTSASKTVQISMWGNLKFDYDFRILNEAAELDGELSNIDFQPHLTTSGRNSLRQTRLQLPRDIWRLSLTDEVGNLTRPIAKYLNDEEIDLVIFPRFSLFGGWKSTYWISYNQWSSKYLSRAREDSSLYRLETSFTHILGPILTKEYKLSFCIPEFATFRGFDSPFHVVDHFVEKSHGLFEYFGKNCYVYNYKNIADKNHKKQVFVYFEFSSSLIFMKLFYVIGVVTFLFGLVFVVSRIDLDFQRQEKVKTD
jgi:hypothetical protein